MSINDVLTLTEVEEIYGIKRVTAKKAVLCGRFYADEIRQSGSTWLVTKAAVYRLWGYRITK